MKGTKLAHAKLLRAMYEKRFAVAEHSAAEAAFAEGRGELRQRRAVQLQCDAIRAATFCCELLVACEEIGVDTSDWPKRAEDPDDRYR